VAWEQYLDAEAQTCDKAVIWRVKKRRKLPWASIGEQTLCLASCFKQGGQKMTTG